MTREALLALSKDDLVVLILAQQSVIEALTARVGELEARLNIPPRTPDNSSLAPSRGQKIDLPARPARPRHGRPGVARALSEHPDRAVTARLRPARTASTRSAWATSPTSMPTTTSTGRPSGRS